MRSKGRSDISWCCSRTEWTCHKKGRFVEHSIYQEALEENQKRVEENPEYYRLRQQITEHQFGTIKRQWSFTHTLMKGKQNVLSEVNLIMICYNLRRLSAILDPKELKNRIKSVGDELSYIFGPISDILGQFLFPVSFSYHKRTGPKTFAWII